MPLDLNFPCQHMQCSKFTGSSVVFTILGILNQRSICQSINNPCSWHNLKQEITTTKKWKKNVNTNTTNTTNTTTTTNTTNTTNNSMQQLAQTVHQSFLHLFNNGCYERTYNPMLNNAAAKPAIICRKL